MAVLVYKIKNFDHTAETEQFYAIRDFLENRFNGEKKNCILIGNINIEGVELDALLITPGGVRILEFKNWGGNIKASENGDWFSDGKIIKGGSSKSPFEQIRLNKSRVSRCFNRESFKELNLNSYVSAAIIFFQPSNIDDSEITGSVKQWLHIFDNEHLKDELLKKLGGTKIPDNIIKELPEKLNIARFRDTEKNGIVSSNSLLDYESELAKEFYEKLETSIEVPDLDYKNLYNIFRDIFYRVLEQKTAAININFGGPFPKTDYLLKENSADWKLATRVHDTRVRLKKSQ